MALSRRALILSGAAIAAVGALGVPEAVLDAAAEGYAVLSPGEVAFVTALGDTLFPATSALGVGAAEVGFVRSVDRILAEVIEGGQARAFRYLLRALDLSGVPTHGASFVALSPEARAQVLDTWDDPEKLPLRMGFEAMKVLAGMAYFDTPAVRRRIGWQAMCGGGEA